MKLDLDDPYRGADHVIGGDWHHHVSFMDSNHVIADPAKDRIAFWGHLPAHNPIWVGQRVIHRYGHHWVALRITKLEWIGSARDMFVGIFTVTHIWALDGQLVWVRRKNLLDRLKRSWR